MRKNIFLVLINVNYVILEIKEKDINYKYYIYFLYQLLKIKNIFFDNRLK